MCSFLSSPLVAFRLVEEVKLRASSCQLQNEDVYMNCTFQDFIQMCVRKLRGEDDEEELVVDYVSVIELLFVTDCPGEDDMLSVVVMMVFNSSGGEEHQQHDHKDASPAVH